MKEWRIIKCWNTKSSFYRVQIKVLFWWVTEKDLNNNEVNFNSAVSARQYILDKYSNNYEIIESGKI